MCNLCEKEYPTFEQCHRLFYIHDDKLFRKHLPLSAFNSLNAQARYNKTANQPCILYGTQKNVQVLGMGQLTEGMIKNIMAGGSPADWNHRVKKYKNQYSSGSWLDSDNDKDKPIPPNYPKYATIPAKIYRNGFLERRL